MATVHTLTADGAPHDAKGKRIGKTTTGVGRAKCGCGWLSDELPSRAARKNAHNTHKVEAAKPTTKKTPPAKKTAAKKTPAKPEKEKTVEATVEAVPELKGVLTEIPYTAPKVHWKWLRECALSYANSVDGITGARYDNTTLTVSVAGTAAARKSVSKGLPVLWQDAETALRANDKSRKDELKELNKTPQGRRSRIPAEGEFLTSYCSDLIAGGLI